ncbi:MAG TPA: hypothetical protein VMX18_03325 [Candidatus Bipolaricaulota bacterium]|nr:hypothetical protein [Candidatus Bipolaricaulota bacterium]
MPQKEGSNSKFAMILALMILIIVAGAAYFFIYRRGFNKSDYQAVFLTNGQVYFGKLTNKNASYVLLKDIYYLQLKEPLQEQQAGSETTPDLSLIKLGNELHGPMDRMEINKDHVLFIEDLQDDSKVVTAILDFKAQQ